MILIIVYCYYLVFGSKCLLYTVLYVFGHWCWSTREYRLLKMDLGSSRCHPMKAEQALSSRWNSMYNYVQNVGRSDRGASRLSQATRVLKRCRP